MLSCEASGITLTELAEKLGTSQANLSKRLKTGKFTQDELAHIANLLGCQYKPSWILPNGDTLE